MPFAVAYISSEPSAKTRIQALPKGRSRNELSMIAILLRIYKKEGIMGWYRGFAATMLNTFSMRMYPIHNLPSLSSKSFDLRICLFLLLLAYSVILHQKTDEETSSGLQGSCLLNHDGAGT